MPPAAVFIDAVNVAYWTGAPAALRLPLALLVALKARGTPARLVVDASARHHAPAESALWAALAEAPQDVTVVPAGRSADTVLLRAARDAGGLIVSRDRFRDHRRRHRRLIDAPGRLVDGHVADDTLHLPALGLAIALPATADAAWAAWKATA